MKTESTMYKSCEFLHYVCVVRCAMYNVRCAMCGKEHTRCTNLFTKITLLHRSDGLHVPPLLRGEPEGDFEDEWSLVELLL